MKKSELNCENNETEHNKLGGDKFKTQTVYPNTNM